MCRKSTTPTHAVWLGIIAIGTLFSVLCRY